MDHAPLPELDTLGPTVDIPTAARLLGCGRSLAYELAKHGQFPCRVLRMGRRYVVPTADLRATLGLPPAPSDPPSRPASS